MEKTLNSFILKRKHPDALKHVVDFDQVRMNFVKNRFNISIELKPRRNEDCGETPININATNLLVLNLNHISAYGHMYSEVFSELYALDKTYPNYDCIVALITPLMREIIDFFGLKLSEKINFICSKTDPAQNFLLNFDQLEIANHSPKSFSNKQQKVLALKDEFHRLKPIANTPKQYLIFCSRTSSKAKNGRNITQENEADVVHYLKTYADEQNLEFCFLTGEDSNGRKTSIATQYELFSNAKIVIGPHGGAFSNLIFLDPAKKPIVIEFCPSWAKSFSILFDGTINTFAEYQQIPYIIPPEVLTDILSYEAGQQRNLYLADQLKDTSCTVRLSDVIEALHGKQFKMNRAINISDIKDTIHTRISSTITTTQNATQSLNAKILS